MKALFTFFLSFQLVVLHAQTVRLISCTRQSWSGGIAGRYGENYIFVVEFSGFKNEPRPDTLWLGNKPVPVTVSGKDDPWNTIRSTDKKAVRFQVYAGASHDDNKDHYPDPNANKKEETYHCPVKYHGVALLSYLYKGKQQYYTITRATRNLPPIAYP